MDFNKNLITMLKNDKDYDKKSIFWQEDLLAEMEDPLDCKDIPEGRFGEFKNQILKVELGINVIFPIVSSNLELTETEDLINEKDCFQVRSKHRLMSIRRIDIEEYKKELIRCNNSDMLLRVEPGVFLERFAGMISDERNGWMIGKISFLQGKGHKVYSFVYAGIGNYTEIRMEEEFIAKRLRV